MDKIAIIGCGWIGLSLAEQLVEQNYAVIGTTTTSNKIADLEERQIIPQLFSINDISDDANWLTDVGIVVIAIPPSKIDQYSSKIAAFCEILDDKKVIYVSSTSVYADNNQNAIETDPLNGTNRSGPEIIKTEGEIRRILKDRLTIVRMAGLVGGERQPAKFFAGKKDLKGGASPINMIHQKDAVGIIIQIIDKNVFGETYNACATMHPTKSEYYTKTCKELGLAKPEFNSDVIPHKTVDNSHSKTHLNYQYCYDNPMEFPLVQF